MCVTTHLHLAKPHYTRDKVSVYGYGSWRTIIHHCFPTNVAYYWLWLTAWSNPPYFCISTGTICISIKDWSNFTRTHRLEPTEVPSPGLSGSKSSRMRSARLAHHRTTWSCCQLPVHEIVGQPVVIIDDHDYWHGSLWITMGLLWITICMISKHDCITIYNTIVYSGSQYGNKDHANYIVGMAW